MPRHIVDRLAAHGFPDVQKRVNRALNQMDEVTLQNSALVEENAATAKTLEEQAKSMDEQVAFFQIDAAAGADDIAHVRVITSKPVTAKPAKAAPVIVEAKAEPNVAAFVKKETSAAKRAAANGGGRGARSMRSQLATALKQDPEWKEF